MNKGTKIRTILGILTTINTVLAVTDVAQFGNETVTFYYKLLSVVINAVVVAINTYYNNDYTEEACIGTGITRQMKAERNEDYIGDIFFTDEDEEIVEDFSEYNDEDESGDEDEQ